ncbi:hypothetical protein [Gloeobacter morelensis]|uniref:Uncharacterized protein n=1 Tax=Gloeobacter morelensis MG652769 TaxID=2781736 RepID=A0ABY3PMB4_9CYAN|nr:hypothetical protein [Gloeobacter morelensis]UFP94826.1 hypothetical protein ISF26_00825 [Gloeobacter morelensis MG652769]
MIHPLASPPVPGQVAPGAHSLGTIAQLDIDDVDQIVGALAWFGGQIYFAGIYIDRDVQDFRRIVRFDPQTRGWQTVHTSLAINTKRRSGPANMLDTFFPDNPTEEQSKDKLTDALGVNLAGEQALGTGRNVYCCLFEEQGRLVASLSSPLGGEVVISAAGESWQTTFELVPAKGHTFHQPVPFGGGVVALATGLSQNAPPLLRGEAMDAAGWEEVPVPGFKEQGNELACRAAVFADSLYIGTRNLERGFQLWRLGAIAAQPGDFEQVIASGAYLFSDNQQVAAMVHFGGCLYIVGGKTHSALRAHQVSGFELFRINADRSWDLIVGKPRFSPMGLKVPFSAMGPGFDDPAAVLQCLVVHEGYLCAGFASRGSFKLFVSPDGEQWSEKPVGHFVGELVAALSTPQGLVLLLNPRPQDQPPAKKGDPLPSIALEAWRFTL